MRERILAALAALGAMLAVGTAVAGGAAPPVTTEDLLLRLVDLEPGYRLGNDGGCGFGASAALPDVCSIDFRREWTVPAGPQSIESQVAVFETVAEAKDAFDQWTGPGRILAPRQVGDETKLFGGSEDWRGARVVWRSGATLAAVYIEGSLAAPVELAMRLADKQQARIVAPTRRSPSDNDDLLVPLDDPSLKLPVYWLGETFTPARLPPLHLVDASSYPGEGSEPGFTTGLGYGSIKWGHNVDIWKPRRWKRFLRSRLGKRLRSKRYGRRVTRRLGDRRLVILASQAVCWRQPPGYEHLEGTGVIGVGPGSDPRKRARVKRCGMGPPDVFMAHVHFRGAVVAIDVPLCYTCVFASRDPYNSARGMRAIARGLHVRERTR